jgi:hypothetical protein
MAVTRERGNEQDKRRLMIGEPLLRRSAKLEGFNYWSRVFTIVQSVGLSTAYNAT